MPQMVNPHATLGTYLNELCDHHLSVQLAKQYGWQIEALKKLKERIIGFVCAVMATGYIMAETAKDDGVMVMDFSHSVQVGPGYVKDGGSLVIDFEADEVNYYSHHGGGMGWSGGFSYSVGEVRNYTSPNDYAGPFVNSSGGYYVGYDDCWDPRAGRESGTGAGSVTFSTGFGAGTGSDYYSTPTHLLKW